MPFGADAADVSTAVVTTLFAVACRGAASTTVTDIAAFAASSTALLIHAFAVPVLTLGVLATVVSVLLIGPTMLVDERQALLALIARLLLPRANATVVNQTGGVIYLR